jgi:hypothetical protein
MSRTYTFPTIKVVGTSTRGKGDSDTSTLQTMFPQSPGLSLTAADYKQTALALLLDGEVTENQLIGNYNRDYSGNGAPNYGDVPTGAGGLPASAWAPNPVSPGEGSTNPSDMAAPPSGFGTTPTNGAHAGSSTAVTAEGRNPSASSTNMSTRVTTAELGQSPATQNAS